MITLDPLTDQPLRSINELDKRTKSHGCTWWTCEREGCRVYPGIDLRHLMVYYASCAGYFILRQSLRLQNRNGVIVFDWL